MLAILLISIKCERVFSSIKHFITNSHNCLKADIVEVNECLKSWFRHLKAKAFQQNINPDINDLYKEEAAAKAAAKATAKKDSNAIGNVNKEVDKEVDKEKDEEEEELSESDCDDGDDESDDNRNRQKPCCVTHDVFSLRASKRNNHR